MRFEAAVLAQLETILAEGFQYHKELDQFLLRAGIPATFVNAARVKAEERNKQAGNFTKAPKRYVAQELMSLLHSKGDQGDHATANLLTQITSNASEKTLIQSDSVKNAIGIIREQYQADKEKKKEDEQEKKRVREELAESEENKKTKAYIGREAKLDNLKTQLHDLIAMQDAHQRGFNLEKFLTQLFEFEGLEPKGSFRIVGEQIDGSFNFQTKTHLLEAKWTKEQCAGAEFGAFMYKIEGKTADTRGLFVSVNGYTEDSIKSLRSKGALKFICIDGSHLYRALEPTVGLKKILNTLWRHASEKGEAYLPVSNMSFDWHCFFTFGHLGFLK